MSFEGPGPDPGGEWNGCPIDGMCICCCCCGGGGG